MDKHQLVEIIEKFAPLHLAEPWDCSGWSVDIADNTIINKVLLCLTVTENVVEQAKTEKCDLIISHHPLFFVPFEYKDINIYCAHTNLDKTEGGTTDVLIKNVLQTQGHILENGFVRIVDLKEPIKISDFADKLRKISPNLRYVNNKNAETIQKIAFCAGSGSEFVDETECDAYVTGDLKFHKAAECDKVLFDLGHFESEIGVLKVFENLLKGRVEVIYAGEKSPFIY